MASKNHSFAAGLLGAVEDARPAPEAPARLGIGVLASRENRMSELASGALLARAVEQVDPARCRIWSEHNRDYAKLNEQNCADLIESLKAQGRQEFPAIVRRVRGEPDIDFEVICGARRHWTVSWLRAHNYTDFRYLVEVRELTDEEAFRVSDLENRARNDLSDIERARDYLRALGRYYGGRQKDMAQRMDKSEAWLSRYLELAKLPAVLINAFDDPHALTIKHVTLLKPLLKPEDRGRRVRETAAKLAEKKGQGPALTPRDVLRLLATAADPPKKTGKDEGQDSDKEVIRSAAGAPVLRVDGRKRKEMSVTLFLGGGVSRDDAEQALRTLFDTYWPGTPSVA